LCEKNVDLEKKTHKPPSDDNNYSDSAKGIGVPKKRNYNDVYAKMSL